MNIDGPSVVPTDPHIVELDRLGDEIAELAAHLDAATARLLDLIRGRLEPEVGAVVMQALTAAREALSPPRRAEDVPGGTSVVDGSAEAPTRRRGRPSPRNGSRRSRRALPGGRSCRRAGARRRR